MRQDGPRVWSSLLPLLPPAALLAIWGLAAKQAWAPAAVLAAPTDVWRALTRLVLEPVFHHHVLVSLLRLASGTALAAVLGAVVGTATATSPTLRQLLSPIIRGLAPVPPVLYTPLLIVFLGLGDEAKIALIAIGGFFIAVVHAHSAAERINAHMRDFARIYRLSLEQRIRHFSVPAVTSEMFQALRLMVGLGWVLLLAAELIASSDGLGWFINDARNFGRTAEMYAATIAVAVLGYLTDLLLVTLKGVVAPWDEPGR